MVECCRESWLRSPAYHLIPQRVQRMCKGASDIMEKNRYEFLHLQFALENQPTNVFDLVMGHSLVMGHLVFTVFHVLKWE